MSAFEMLIQQSINGLMLGMMYALVAVGFTLYFGVLDLIHFGHGDFFMLGGFMALILYTVGESLGWADSVGGLLIFHGVHWFNVILTAIISSCHREVGNNAGSESAHADHVAGYTGSLVSRSVNWFVSSTHLVRILNFSLLCCHRVILQSVTYSFDMKT